MMDRHARPTDRGTTKHLPIEKLELVGGPYDGEHVTVLIGTPQLTLAFKPGGVQSYQDRRRARYVRRGNRLVYAGVFLIRSAWDRRVTL